MADVLGKKISELAETTDLAGLYTIGSDRNNQSKKVSLQFGAREDIFLVSKSSSLNPSPGISLQGSRQMNFAALSGSFQTQR